MKNVRDIGIWVLGGLLIVALIGSILLLVNPDILKNLQPLNTIVLILSALIAVSKYGTERQRDRKVREDELTWNKTKVILKLAERFHNNKQYRRALEIIQFEEGALKRILGPDKKSLLQAERQDRLDIDSFLDFFDYLYHIVIITGALKPLELECFLWYLRIIKETPEIKKYVDIEENGFKDVLDLYDKVQAASEENAKKAT